MACHMIPGSPVTLMQLGSSGAPLCGKPPFPLGRETSPALHRWMGLPSPGNSSRVSGLPNLSYSHLCTSYREFDFQARSEPPVEPLRQKDTKSGPRLGTPGARGWGVRGEAGFWGTWSDPRPPSGFDHLDAGSALGPWRGGWETRRRLHSSGKPSEPGARLETRSLLSRSGLGRCRERPTPRGSQGQGNPASMFYICSSPQLWLLGASTGARPWKSAPRIYFLLEF